MKFSRETLIKIIKEEAEMAHKEAENAENDPGSAASQLAWMDKSMEIIRDAIDGDGKLDPEMLEILGRAAAMMDHIADGLAFGKLVKQHVDGDSEEGHVNED